MHKEYILLNGFRKAKKGFTAGFHVPLNDPVIILCENDKIVSEQAAVSGILNEFYVNVARDIGNGLSPDDIETHSSIHAIRAKFQNVTPFNFNPITNERVKTFIGKSSSKKSHWS